MPKLSNQQFRNMNINDISSYVQEHPAEGMRATRILGHASARTLQTYIDYQLHRAMQIATPPSLRNQPE